MRTAGRPASSLSSTSVIAPINCLSKPVDVVSPLLGEEESLSGALTRSAQESSVGGRGAVELSYGEELGVALQRSLCTPSGVIYLECTHSHQSLLSLRLITRCTSRLARR